ncbi:TrmH family RNA methyltransferase [Ktedonospora formicarum]|uniref:rRNA methyltransferase n=1 Tax=Ktedonospora formicarum TaxID=2778364 RepID=A0A8J3HYD2_9CHLR|nr:RNA methyltransferase [Ktedonospora formicarum]GHO44221.1 rRNA methyltransferase [Ktedonospora formicarum]
MLDVLKLIPAGLHNAQVKQYLATKNNTKANSKQLICLEGLRPIQAAFDAGLEICCLFICPERLRGNEAHAFIYQVSQRGFPLYQVSEKVLHAMVDWEGPDGLAAMACLRHYNLSSLSLNQCSTLLILDGLQIPGNIGTVIRCADGAGANGIIITNRRQRLTHPKLVRASMGSLFALPVIESDIDTTFTWLKHHQFQIVTTNPEASISFRQARYSKRTAIVMGNEREGISHAWFEHHDLSVSIPMRGRADSLNVGNAAVLMLYEVLHQQQSELANS